MSAGALAAVVALIIGVRPLFVAARLRGTAEGVAAESLRSERPARAAVTVQIGSENGPQRTASPYRPELLSSGERVRVAVQPGARRFLFAIAVNDHGAVTPLYPEVGTSMPLPGGAGLQYLPDTLELAGKGRQRLVVLLSSAPLEMDNVQRATAEAFRRAGGDLDRIQNLPLAVDQFHRTFVRP